MYFQSCKALIVVDPGITLLQEIPKKPTYPMKNAGSIKRVRVGFYRKKRVNIKELGKYSNYTTLWRNLRKAEDKILNKTISEHNNQYTQTCKSTPVGTTTGKEKAKTNIVLCRVVQSVLKKKNTF